MPQADITPISAILQHEAAIGSALTVAGWVRSRRTSKGGFSFIELSDGSCFDTLQVVAADALPNYLADVVELGTGCAVEITGTVVEPVGAKQDRELAATRVVVHGRADAESRRRDLLRRRRPRERP